MVLDVFNLVRLEAMIRVLLPATTSSHGNVVLPVLPHLGNSVVAEMIVMDSTLVTVLLEVLHLG